MKRSCGLEIKAALSWADLVRLPEGRGADKKRKWSELLLLNWYI